MLESSSENGWIMDTYLINYFLSFFSPKPFFPVLILMPAYSQSCSYSGQYSSTGITVHVHDQQINLRDDIWTGVQIFIFSRLSKQLSQLSYFSDFYIMSCKIEQLSTCLSHSFLPFQGSVEWWSQFAYRVLNHAGKETEPAATQVEHWSPWLMLCTAMAKLHHTLCSENIS